MPKLVFNGILPTLTAPLLAFVLDHTVNVYGLVSKQRLCTAHVASGELYTADSLSSPSRGVYKSESLGQGSRLLIARVSFPLFIVQLALSILSSSSLYNDEVDAALLRPSANFPFLSKAQCCFRASAMRQGSVGAQLALKNLSRRALGICNCVQQV